MSKPKHNPKYMPQPRHATDLIRKHRRKATA